MNETPLPPAPAFSSIDESALPGPDDVERAAVELAGQVLLTPVFRAPALERPGRARLWLKAENLQLAGSYKIRGATLAVGRSAARGVQGVIAQSTGNHAIAVAQAAGRFGLSATVVLPVDASPAKVARARAAGAHVIQAGHSLEERLATVERLSQATGFTVIDAFDQADVVAGQGTASRELLAQADGLDTLVVPVGGGGGIAGACLAAAGLGISVIGVEPVGCDSLAQSLAAGRPVRVDPAATLADGLRPAQVGRIPFAIARTGVERVLTVDDDEIGKAVYSLMFQAGILAEPSAAAALAGALRIADEEPERTIGVLLTGGNAEPSVIRGLIDRLGTKGAGLNAGPVAG